MGETVFTDIIFPWIVSFCKLARLSDMFSNVLEITVYASFIIAPALIFGKAIKKRYGVKWRYFVWLVIAVRLIIPFNVSLPERAVTINAPESVVTLEPNEGFALESSESENAPVTYSVQYPSALRVEPNGIITRPFRLTAMEALSLIWAAGVILFLLYQGIAYALFKKRVKRWRAPADEETRRIFRELKIDMGIMRDINIYRCSEIDSPMLIGFTDTMVLLPKNELNAEQLALVLRHELVHYSRRDLWYKLALTIANAMHWFNPLVYAMAKSANNDLELICDSITISAANKPDEYARAMLEIMKNSRGFKPALSTHFLGGKQAMKERFRTIFDTTVKKRGIALLTAVLAVSVLGGALVACGSGDAVENAAKELYEYKSPYIGNNWNSIELFNHIPFIADMPYSSTELDTDRDDNSVPEGYGLKLYYERRDAESGKNLVYKRNELSGAAAVFLALIDNADYVAFTAPDYDSASYSEFSVTKRECADLYGSLFTNAGESPENFAEFYRVIEENLWYDGKPTGMEAPLRPTDIDEAVDDAVIARHERTAGGGYVSVAAHNTAINTETDGVYTEYVHTLYSSYGVRDGIYTVMSGVSEPAIIRFKKDENGGFYVTEYLSFDEIKGKPMPEDISISEQMWNDFIGGKYGGGLDEQSDGKLREYLLGNAIDAEVDYDYNQTALNYDGIFDYFPDLASKILSEGGFWEYPEYQGTKRVIKDGKRVTLSTDFYISGDPKTPDRIIYNTTDDAGQIIESFTVYVTGGKTFEIDNTAA